MRVISGKFKGKPLYSPTSDNIRPTSDQIKETLFNILANFSSPEDKTVLDLFSGSGALGIEALSRGASRVVFTDKDAASVALTKKNLKYIGADCNVYLAEYHLSLKKLTNEAFDLIFIDPPYADRREREITDLILKFQVLSESGIIAIEHDVKNELELSSELELIKNRKCGTTMLSFYKKKQAEPQV